MVNAADVWVRDPHTYGDTGIDDSIPPAALPGEAERLYAVLHDPNRGATPTDALTGVLKTRGLTGARLGLDIEGLNGQAKQALRAALPHAEPKDCSNLLTPHIERSFVVTPDGCRPLVEQDRSGPVRPSDTESGA